MGLPAEGSQVFDYDANGLTTYQGWAKRKGASTAAAIWKIKKFVYNTAGGVTSMQWADGNEIYDNIWDNRATTVSYY